MGGRFENFTPPTLGSELSTSEITMLEELTALANSGTGEFIRKSAGSLVNATLSETVALSGLSDVSISGPASGQFLQYNGSAWVNSDEAFLGTVTSVSVVTANGVSGTVANSEISPAITLSLGAITPTSVAINGGTALTTSNQTGTGDLVLATSPTLVTPALGTPASGVLTSCTGLPEGGLLDNAVTLAKMAGGTDGNLITYDAAGDPAYVATGTSGQLLTSNGVGAAPTFQDAAAAAHNVLSATHSDALAASVVLGDIVHGNATPAWARLAGNTTTTRQFLTQTGNGSISAVPAWGNVEEVEMTDYGATSTVVGWASYTSGPNIFYKKIGKTIFFHFAIDGTSNSTSVTFTLPPAYANFDTIQTNVVYGNVAWRDNGTWGTVAGRWYISRLSNVINVNSSWGGAGWTATGTKTVYGSGFYDTTA